MSLFTNMISKLVFLERVNFYEILASNIVIASALALVAFAATRVWRNPHLAHSLWLLVLIKLVTPPLVSINFPELSSATELRGRDEEIEMTATNSAATMPTPIGTSPLVVSPEDTQGDAEWQIGDSVAETNKNASTLIELEPSPGLALGIASRPKCRRPLWRESNWMYLRTRLLTDRWCRLLRISCRRNG